MPIDLLDQELSADEALARLVAGNKRFRRRESTAIVRENFADPISGPPFATVLACSDCHVAPESIFDARSGDIFVVRVAGNVLAPEIAASLQYAGTHLQTPLFVVLGHDGCAAVRAALELKYTGAKQPLRIPLLADLISPALPVFAPHVSPRDRLARAVECNVRWTVQQLLATPEAEARLATGRMRALGAVLEAGSRRVRFLT